MQTHMPQTQNDTTEQQEAKGISMSVGQSKSSAKAATKAADAFLTISEVSEKLDVPQHVLRFWETKFTQVRPLKRGGGRRYYRPEDVAVLTHIHSLLYGEGYTIKGVQKLLKGQGKNQVAQAAQRKSLPEPANETKAPASAVATPSARTQNAFHAQQKPGFSPTQKQALEGLLSDLKDLRGMFKPVK